MTLYDSNWDMVYVHAISVALVGVSLVTQSNQALGTLLQQNQKTL